MRLLQIQDYRLLDLSAKSVICIHRRDGVCGCSVDLILLIV